jgi:exopolysaccharide production protein ExoZ
MSGADSRKSFLILDAFRGCAALWVVLYHGRLESVVPRFPGIEHNAFYAFSTLGSLGVQLFFVISGYCIASAAAASLRREDHSLAFMWARLRRI